MNNGPNQANSADAEYRAADLQRCCRTLRARQQSPRITIRWVLGAPRLTTSGCSRRSRRQTSLPPVSLLIRRDYVKNKI